MPGRGRRAALILAKGRPPKRQQKAREVTRVTCQEELTALMACWATHSFDETKCVERADAFHNCVRSKPPATKKVGRQGWHAAKDLTSVHSAK